VFVLFHIFQNIFFKLKIKKQVKEIIDNLDIQKIEIVINNNTLLNKLIQQAMINYLCQIKGDKIYIVKKYSYFDILTQSEYLNLPPDHPIKQKIPFLFYPYIGNMVFHWWIYKDSGGFLTKIIHEGTSNDFFKHFSCEQDVESAIKVAYEGTAADDESLMYIETIVSYYQQLLKLDRHQLLEFVKKS
jgi:hypothetical protein